MDSSTLAVWSKSSVDFEPRRIRLQSNSYTTNTLLDIVTAATVQVGVSNCNLCIFIMMKISACFINVIGIYSSDMFACVCTESLIGFTCFKILDTNCVLLLFFIFKIMLELLYLLQGGCSIRSNNNLV